MVHVHHFFFLLTIFFSFQSSSFTQYFISYFYYDSTRRECVNFFFVFYFFSFHHIEFCTQINSMVYINNIRFPNNCTLHSQYALPYRITRSYHSYFVYFFFFSIQFTFLRHRNDIMLNYFFFHLSSLAYFFRFFSIFDFFQFFSSLFPIFCVIVELLLVCCLGFGSINNR